MSAIACAHVAARVWTEVAAGLRPVDHALRLSTHPHERRRLYHAITRRIGRNHPAGPVRRIDVHERDRVAFAVVLFEHHDRMLAMSILLRRTGDTWRVASASLLTPENMHR